MEIRVHIRGKSFKKVRSEISELVQKVFIGFKVKGECGCIFASWDKTMSREEVKYKLEALAREVCALLNGAGYKLIKGVLLLGEGQSFQVFLKKVGGKWTMETGQFAILSRGRISTTRDFYGEILLMHAKEA